jgi:phage terminase small subunit
MPILTNAKHEAFAQGLAKGLSASEAYTAAGYANSRSGASRLATNENIEARVAELIDKGAQRAEIGIARVLQELGRIGFSDLRTAFTDTGALKSPQDWSDDLAAAISSVEVTTRSLGKDEDGNLEVEHVHKIRLWDKNSALEKIAKHLGMFVEKVEHSGPNGGAIPIGPTAADLSEAIASKLARITATGSAK